MAAKKRTSKHRHAPDTPAAESPHLAEPVDAEAPGTAVFYAMAALPAAAFALFVLGFGMFGATVTAGLDRACAEASFVAGKQMEDAGHLEQAVQLYRDALEGRFNSTANELLCQRSLGEVLWRLERPGEAIAAFESMPAAGFAQSGSYTAFVSALLHEGDLERALEMGRQWLDLAAAESNTQQMVWAQFALGQIHQQLGQYEAALEAYRAAHGLEPGSTASLAVARMLLSLDRRDEARTHIRSVIADLPEGRTRREAEGILERIDAGS